MLGAELNVKTVAEGSRTRIGDQLRDFGCDAAQGYHYAYPMEEAEFLRWLKEHA
jgi:EAL domain-containing protein (putative c-di-GMP-specific phosphodiesterase class I)